MKRSSGRVKNREGATGLAVAPIRRTEEAAAAHP